MRNRKNKKYTKKIDYKKAEGMIYMSVHGPSIFDRDIDKLTELELTIEAVETMRKYLEMSVEKKLSGVLVDVALTRFKYYSRRLDKMQNEQK